MAKIHLGLGLALLLGVAAGAADRTPGTGPWDVRALQKTPRHEVVDAEEVAEKTPEGEVRVRVSRLYYDGEPWLGKPTRVFAYYARPAALPEPKLPAMVLVHGGGGTAFPEWARLWAARGYAALAMDLSGRGPDKQRLPDGGPEQDEEWKFRRLKEGVKNAWSYQAVAAVLRGTSLLRSFPEVDRNRIGVTGISWGGYLTCIAMSLDDRLKAAVPVYGCGFLHENSVWVPTLASLPAEERRTWVESFDPSRYLPRCKTPVLWVNGTNDFAYPLDSYQKSYRAVRGPRLLSVTVGMPHGHPAGWAPREIHLFTDSIFRRKELARGLPLVTAPVVDGSRVQVGVDSEAAVLRARLHWTVETRKPWQERRWESANARVVSLDEVRATLPEARPLVFFLTVTDRRGATVSTEHVELGTP